ncbi:MAG: YHS domain-containing protein, partial [Sideroxyarcus sp.]|nr:YHS domain-containing protein [Sideroxyarcus sp.]
MYSNIFFERTFMMFLESRRLWLVIVAIAVGSFVFYRVADACGGSCGGGDSGHQHNSGNSGKVQQDSNRPQDSNKPQGQAKAAEQTTCPVMGDAINKKIFTTYKGKKVYFCCAGCKPKFEKNPEKYMEKLPQFG